MQRRYELSDDEWHLIQDLFPPPKKMGRPRRDDRTLFNGVFWILCSGAAWHDLTSCGRGEKKTAKRVKKSPQITL